MRFLSFWSCVAVAACASLSSVGCKQKDADPQGLSRRAQTSGSATMKFSWCRASPAAMHAVMEAIASMDRAGRTSVNTHDTQPIAQTALPAVAAELLNNPPPSDPPRCDAFSDSALLQSERQVAAALGDAPKDTALALGGSCEIENSSGILSITRLASGNYRIEILGCGGRQRSEMILNPKQLKSLGGILLRGV